MRSGHSWICCVSVNVGNLCIRTWKFGKTTIWLLRLGEGPVLFIRQGVCLRIGEIKGSIKSNSAGWTTAEDVWACLLLEERLRQATVEVLNLGSVVP